MRKAIASIPFLVWGCLCFAAAGVVIVAAYGDYSQREERVSAIRRANQAELAGELCPEYFAQPAYVRLTGFRSLSWCEDYRGVPKAELAKPKSPAEVKEQDASYAQWLGQASGGK